MSAFTGPHDIEMTEIIARIERAQEETRKFSAETRKLMSESGKLEAETQKINRDHRLAPFATVVTVLGALAALALAVHTFLPGTGH